MKKCSYCGHENDDGARECAGCGEAFEKPALQGGTAELKDPANAPVLVAAFDTLDEAEVLKAELEAAGIEAFIPEEYSAGVYSTVIPFKSFSVGVPANHAEAARNIAGTFAASRAKAGETAEAKEKPPAPSAGNTGGTAAALGGEYPPGLAPCVMCGALIPLDSVLCPKCGWTQPRLA